MKRSIVSPGFVKRTLAKLLKLDQQLGIVVDGNVASKAIAVGKYVNLINSTITGKPDGIYVATGAVSSGGTVTAADISGNAVSDGVTNDLSEQIAKLAPKGMKRINNNESASFTFPSYQLTAIIFVACTNTNGALYVFSNGYLAPIKSDTYFTATLSADYRTITITNLSSTAVYVGYISCKDMATVT